MLVFGLAIFTGAFLLFLVQPLIAKFILPWFGGTPAVWTTCMLFFQMLLLGGYAYAHWSKSRLTPRRQVIVHLVLLGLALATLPITPGEHWKPVDGSQPTWRILLLLGGCLGLPYLVISATGPLFQAWFSQAHPGVSPYRLYALSNVGSLLALLSYPLIVETNLPRHAQAVTWSVGLGVFALLAVWCGRLVWKNSDKTDKAATAPAPATVESSSAATGRWLWFALPAVGSVLLLAITNKICQDLAVIPFLWVIPLSLYLLTFIICFDSPRWYWRPFWLPALAVSFGFVMWTVCGDSITAPSANWLQPVTWLLETGDNVGMFHEIGILTAFLFIACMVCHGEVYRLRPAAEKLTGFYLMISAGGAAGGLLVAVVAPAVFNHYFEFQIALFAVAVLVASVLFVDPGSPLHEGRRVWAWALIALAVVGLGAGAFQNARYSVRAALEVSRNFYGVLKVNEYYPDDEDRHKLMLQHGGTTHGLQFMSETKRRLPSSYYTSTSGIGRAMKHFPRGDRHIGVVGLGTGSMAVWGREGDRMKFYEINTEVERIARSRFTYLKDTHAKVEIVHGDARLSLEREPDNQFDVLVLDAFSSDAIPVHLLTREAFEIYQRHMKPDGVIAVHISNRYLNLEPILMLIGTHIGYGIEFIDDADVDEREEDEESHGIYASEWVLLSNNKEFMALPAIHDAAIEHPKVSPKLRLWTDEESNLWRILMF